MENIRKEIADNLNEFLTNISKVEPMKIASEVTSEERSLEQIQLFEKLTNVSIKNKTILEVGCGFGMTTTMLAKKYNAQAFGIEPDEKSYKIALKIFDKYNIEKNYLKHGVGEDLPFQDNTFDIVCSFNVLEHTNSPAKVLSESIRVLKKNGYLYFVIPNYGSFWEGHYGILWIPYMPKWLAKLYVKLLFKRPDYYIDTLHLINYFSLKKILKEFNQLEILNWGEKTFEERIEKMDLAKWACLYRLEKYLVWIHKLKMVSVIKFFGKIFKFHTPLILIAKKKK